MVMFVFLLQCNQHKANHKDLVLATWRTDSVYTFYNGFGFMYRDFDEEPLHRYEDDGSLKMLRGNESRTFLYTLPHEDTLVHRNQKRKSYEKFFILQLDEARLVLKKQMKPVFEGRNQERYEIRYLSKVKDQN